MAPKQDPAKRTKVAREVPNLVSDDIERLRQIFPQIFSEGKVDFEKLRATLGDIVETRPERFIFSWAGKRNAIQILQMPTRATLVPIRNESVDFDESKNIFIEGDNLEVLKLLSKPYFGRVKMMYIDPPYNTGNDFVYQDNYADPLEAYLKLTGQRSAEGDLLTSNPETSGRFHSSWLSMMYPRLFLAKQLLEDGGVIFVSIDEHEVYNLRQIMNEIFGEENFVAEFIWKARAGKTGTISQVSFQHEYVICYQSTSQAKLKKQERVKVGGTYSDDKGKYQREQLRQWGQADRREDRPQMFYPIKGPRGIEIYPMKDDGTEGRWRCGKTKAEAMASNGDLDYEQVGGRWQVYRKIREGRSTFSAYGTILEDVGTTADGTKVLQELMGARVMDFPKPPSLMKFLIDLGTWDDDQAIVMDFFAGSCSTAEAVFDLNRDDGGNRRFIMVQLQEPTPKDSIARKEGYATISDIGKERIRRVIRKHKQNAQTTLKKTVTDGLGFKVFKLSESNYKPWKGVDEKTPEKYAIEMKEHIDSLVKDWKREDVIYEVAIKEGLGLTSLIERERKYTENEIWKVTDKESGQFFLICLDNKVGSTTIRNLDTSKDAMFVCRDVAIDDTGAANLALQTILKTI